MSSAETWIFLLGSKTSTTQVGSPLVHEMLCAGTALSMMDSGGPTGRVESAIWETGLPGQAANYGLSGVPTPRIEVDTRDVVANRRIAKMRCVSRCPGGPSLLALIRHCRRQAMRRYDQSTLVLP
jgi:hypothetical protein